MQSALTALPVALALAGEARGTARRATQGAATHRTPAAPGVCFFTSRTDPSAWTRFVVTFVLSK